MSLILNALKRTQKIRWESRQRTQRFGKNIPWLSRWSKRDVIAGRRLIFMGLASAIVLGVILIKPWVRKPSTVVSPPAGGHRVTLPIPQPPDIRKLRQVPVPLVPMDGHQVPGVDPLGEGQQLFLRRMPTGVYVLQRRPGLDELVGHSNVVRAFQVPLPHREDPAVIRTQNDTLALVVPQERRAQHDHAVAKVGLQPLGAHGVP